MRVTVEAAFLPVSTAGRAGILRSVLTVVLMATATVAVVHHWAPEEVAAVSTLAMAARSPVEAALRERDCCPPMCFEALGSLHSRSTHSMRPQAKHRPCLRSSPPSESAVVYISDFAVRIGCTETSCHTSF